MWQHQALCHPGYLLIATCLYINLFGVICLWLFRTIAFSGVFFLAGRVWGGKRHQPQVDIADTGHFSRSVRISIDGRMVESYNLGRNT
jgi:hypothetical protein